MPVSPVIGKPIAQVMENPVLQPKVPVPETSRICDKIVPECAIPHISSGDDSSYRMVKRKTIQDVSREIPIYPDPVYRPPPKPIKSPMSDVPRSLSDFDQEINTDFEKKFTISRGCDLRNVPKARYVIFPETTRIE